MGVVENKKKNQILPNYRVFMIYLYLHNNSFFCVRSQWNLKMFYYFVSGDIKKYQCRHGHVKKQNKINS